MKTFQEILRTLSEFWEKQGCIIHQGYDLEVGAGTFNPATFLRALGKEPYRAAYIEPSRRPTDGRYGENPIRMQHYFQYQVILKPSPKNILDLYLQSLQAIGFDLSKHDIRFVHDDWESPTLGASGLGWEVWMDGMEVTQFTYFQTLGGQELFPITGEITYGIERLATFLQGVSSTYDLQWSHDIKYGDIYKRNEYEWSHYNFTEADTAMWWTQFELFEKEAKKIIEKKLPLPAYDFVLKASHAFNMLDARGAISVSERNTYIARIRDLASQVADLYVKSREEQGFPLLSKFKDFQEKEEEKKDLSLPNLEHTTLTDFLLEIGVEELPATFVPIGMSGLERGIKTFLDSHNITYKTIEVYGTPRRLAVRVFDIITEKPARHIEKRGPQIVQSFDAEGNPTPASLGFFRSINIAPLTLSEIEKGSSKQVKIIEIKGVKYLQAEISEPAVATASLLQENLKEIILKIDFPKKMRWGSEKISFARPIRWLVALLGKEVLPFTVSTITSGRTSHGHRLLANQPVDIESPATYLSTLASVKVLADVKMRRDAILQQLSSIEKEVKGKAIEVEKVIPEVLNLVEYPTLTHSNFDESYLKAPAEILISEMVEHQKYFPVVEPEGKLKNVFIITSNTSPTDLIRKGNQKVLSARLFDGNFLFEQDKKVALSTFYEKLENVTFMKGLGSLQEKSKRLEKHMMTLLPYFDVEKEKAVRAANLSKIDLVTGVVYEFPELQGVMGSIYASLAGESEEVSKSLEEQYFPKGEKHPLPKTSLGALLSLSEKIDNVISCFILGLKPTSSSDPYALRRQVLGIIRIILDRKIHLPLNEVIEECFSHFKNQNFDKAAVSKEIFTFIESRIKTIFEATGLKKDEIEASLAGGGSDIYDIFCRITALHSFRESDKAFAPLYEVYKRAKGQVPNKALSLSELHLKAPSEIELYKTFQISSKEVEKAIASKSYDTAYLYLATLQPPLNKLFEEVKVLDDDPTIRDNRLALLQKVFMLFGTLLDFSKIHE